MNPAIGYSALILVSLSTAFIGFYGLRVSRTTSDFYVASRTVRPWWNASAIGGEYLSAASFLGIAGLIVISGLDALWFPIGYTAGYLMLLFFVAAPLRRSGAYTIPDFAQARLESTTARYVTSLLVVAVGWFYIVPQLHGAALTIRTTTGLPSWVGAGAVVVVVCLTVVTGGMRSITFVQAFQYWLKLTALAVPAVFMLLVVSGVTGQNSAASIPAGSRAFPAGESVHRRLHVRHALAHGCPALWHPGPAACAGAFLYKPRRRSRPPHHADRLGAAVHFLLFPHHLRGAGQGVVCPGWRPRAPPMPQCCSCPER